MFDTIAGRYDLINRLMTLGLDRRWRRRAIDELRLARGQVVLDIGCGTGDLLHEAVASGLVCFGVDLSFAMLAAAHSASLVLEADASLLPVRTRSVDGVVSGFALRNFTDQAAVLTEVARVLRPGGRLCILEVDRPQHRLIRIGHRFWFNSVVPAIGAVFSVASAYRYLPKSMAYLPDPEQLSAMLTDAGFSDIQRLPLQGGLAQIVTGTLRQR